MVLDMTRHMAELGPDVVQQFDQGPGPMACYATEPRPSSRARAVDGGGFQWTRNKPMWPRHGQSILRSPCPAKALRRKLTFRISRSGMLASAPVPCTRFCITNTPTGFEGFYTNRVNDEALRLSVARALVNGYQVNFTLRDKGQVEYDWDQTWTRAVPDQAAFLDWTKQAQPFPRGRSARLSRLRTHAAALEGERSYVARLRLGQGTPGAVRNLASAGRASRRWCWPTLRTCRSLRAWKCGGRREENLVLDIDGQKEVREVELPEVVDITMHPRSLCLIELK